MEYKRLNTMTVERNPYLARLNGRLVRVRHERRIPGGVACDIKVLDTRGWDTVTEWTEPKVNLTSWKAV